MFIGDFNMLACQNLYNEIKQQGFNDSFEDAHFMKGTFGGFVNSPKLLRIDYMFYKGNLMPTYSERFKLENSDHCGLLTDFKFGSTSVNSDL